MAPNNRREIGQHYEQLAAQFLIKQGLTLVAQNVQARVGELDLIMKEGKTLVFVEVKYRQNQHHGHAAESVTPQKQQRLIKTAYYWMQRHNLLDCHSDFRFDIIAIHQQGQDIHWLKNAITEG